MAGGQDATLTAVEMPHGLFHVEHPAARQMALE